MQDSKVVIITGASSGFGRLAAITAARRGYRVVAAARRATLIEALVQEIEAAGGTALAVPGDVTLADDQQRLIETTLDRFGRIDILVNNAGVPLPGGFADASLDELRRQWKTNTTSLIELTKRALPALIERHGIVINVSSSISRFSVPGWGLYAPTKVAASSITDTLRRELRSLGVRVCLVEPGPYDTEFTDRAGLPNGFGSALDPQDVADAIVRLFERPRRLTVVPGWLRPLLALGGGVATALPGLVDLVFWMIGRQRQRQNMGAG